MQVVNIHGEKLGIDYEECQERGCRNYRVLLNAERISRNHIGITVTKVMCLTGEEECKWATKGEEVE